MYSHGVTVKNCIAPGLSTRNKVLTGLFAQKASTSDVSAERRPLCSAEYNISGAGEGRGGEGSVGWRAAGRSEGTDLCHV